MKQKFKLVSFFITMLCLACLFSGCDDCEGNTNVSKYAKFGSDKTKVFLRDNDDVFITERYVITPPSNAREYTGWEVNYIDFIHCRINGEEHILMSHVIRHDSGVSQTTEHIHGCPGCTNIQN